MLSWIILKLIANWAAYLHSSLPNIYYSRSPRITSSHHHCSLYPRIQMFPLHIKFLIPNKCSSLTTKLYYPINAIHKFSNKNSIKTWVTLVEEFQFHLKMSFYRGSLIGCTSCARCSPSPRVILVHPRKLERDDGKDILWVLDWGSSSLPECLGPTRVSRRNTVMESDGWRWTLVGQSGYQAQKTKDKECSVPSSRF